ncbi:MAG: hypothetical protein ACT4PV_07120 [Planctomycetaceae bacterium]
MRPAAFGLLLLLGTAAFPREEAVDLDWTHEGYGRLFEAFLQAKASGHRVLLGRFGADS